VQGLVAAMDAAADAPPPRARHRLAPLTPAPGLFHVAANGIGPSSQRFRQKHFLESLGMTTVGM
jgi:hypothetical protein